MRSAKKNAVHEILWSALRLVLLNANLKFEVCITVTIKFLQENKQNSAQDNVKILVYRYFSLTSLTCMNTQFLV